MNITVCGAAGYVGKHLSDYLEKLGHSVLRWTRERGDLMRPGCAVEAVADADIVFNLAASVGGIGYVSGHRVPCLLSSVINTNLLQACAARGGIVRYFFASSSCVYPENSFGIAQTEDSAYPANPTTEYGWEKLFSERMCAAFSAEQNLPTTVARFHGIFGPGDIRPEGRDHVIVALCRKVIAAKLSGCHEIAIWGDGTQTRSFLHVDDCVEGICRLTFEGVPGPVNLASNESVSVNELVSMLEEIAAVKLTRFYSPAAPVGCQHKTANIAALRRALKWEPTRTLKVGLEDVYRDLWDRLIQTR